MLPLKSSLLSLSADTMYCIMYIGWTCCSLKAHARVPLLAWIYILLVSCCYFIDGLWWVIWLSSTFLVTRTMCNNPPSTWLAKGLLWYLILKNIPRRWYGVFSGTVPYFAWNATVKVGGVKVGIWTKDLKFHYRAKKTKLHGLSPRANYTDWATVACRRSDSNFCG
jgi:hypothetical protein